MNPIKYLAGYVEIEVSGPFLERFINICTARGIILWDIERLSDTLMRTKISADAFRNLEKPLERTKSKAKILHKAGLPFLLKRYKKRNFALLVIIIFFVIFHYLSVHVTQILVTGNEKIAAEEIIDELKNFGVKLGKKVSKIDEKDTESKLMSSRDDLAWVGINVEGSKVYVEIKERRALAKKVPENVPCNIVASKDGVIESMKVIEGLQSAEIRGAVRAGDLLVSGIIDNKVKGIIYKHAVAEVIAKTFYKESEIVPLEFDEKIDTGSSKSRRNLEIMGKRVRFSRKIPYTHYEKIEIEHKFKKFGDLIPIKIVETKYVEKNIVPKTRTRDEAIDFGINELKAKLGEKIPPNAKINNIASDYEILDGGKINVAVEYECLEDIGIEKVIEN
jgi:similar to stage IV sporulation protein